MESRISAIAALLSTPHAALMPNNLASFAIHVDDVQRARRFYEAAFGWRFEPWGPPDFYLIHTGDEKNPGVQGLLHKRLVPLVKGGFNGFECTFSVVDLDAIIQAVETGGGKITMTKSTIPTVGTMIEFTDPDANVVRAMRYENPPHT